MKPLAFFAICVLFSSLAYVLGVAGFPVAFTRQGENASQSPKYALLELERQRALTSLKDKLSDPLQFRELYELASLWAVTDPMGAIALAKHDLPKHALFLKELLRTWALRDPDSALLGAVALGHPGRPEDANRHRYASRNYSKERANSEEVARNERSSYVAYLLETVAERDPERAVELLDTLKGIGQKNEAIVGLGRGMYRADAVSAREWAAALPDAARRTFALSALAQEAMREDPLGAKAIIQDLPLSQASMYTYREYGKILASEASLHSALSWLDDTVPVGSYVHSNIMKDLSDALVESPAAALETLQMRDANFSDSPHLLDSLVRAWTASDSVSALDWVQLLPGNTQPLAYRAFLGQVALENPDHAYALAMGDTGDPAASLLSVVEALGRSQPERSLQLLQEGFLELGVSAENSDLHVPAMISSLVTELSMENPLAAYQHLSATKALNNISKEYQEAYFAITQNFLRLNSEAAVRFVNDQPEGLEKTAGIIAISYFLVRENPQLAVNWISQIPDFDVRRRRLGQLLVELPASEDKRTLLLRAPLSEQDLEAHKRHLKH